MIHPNDTISDTGPSILISKCVLYVFHYINYMDDAYVDPGFDIAHERNSEDTELLQEVWLALLTSGGLGTDLPKHHHHVKITLTQEKSLKELLRIKSNVC